MKPFFIDVSDNYRYDWSLSGECEEVVRIASNAKKALFVCNSHAGLTSGDLYYIELFDNDCEDFYILRTGFKKVQPSEEVMRKARRYLSEYGYEFPY